MTKVQIRSEVPGDRQMIFDLTTAAFSPMSFSDGSEPAAIDQMRERGELALSLVATLDDKIVGHIAFSPARISASEGDWFGLGPISVDPDHQRRGIGRQLVEAGVDILKDRAAGCVLTGNPALYTRLGFTGSDGTLQHPGTAHRFVLSRCFGNTKPTGVLTFAAPLEDC